MLFQDDGVSRVALVHRIHNITEEGDQADDEINDYIDQHRRAQTRWESALDLFAVFDHHHRQRTVADVTNAVAQLASKPKSRQANQDLQWHNPNHAAPSEADAAQIEQSIVQSVGSALDLGQDFGIMFRQSWRYGLAALASFLAKGAAQARCGDFFKVGVLYSSRLG